MADEVRQDLANVTQELVGNRERIMFQLDVMDRMASGGEAMLKLMESNPTTIVTNIPDTLAFLGTFGSPTLDASLGAVEALIASGRLGSVADPAVRLRLAGLRDRIEDAVENQPRSIELYDDYLIPLIYSEFDQAALLRVAALFWNNEERIVGRALVS